jgi:dynein heavy chain
MKIYNCNVICCAAPPEGGRNALTERFTSKFHMLCMPPTSEDATMLIFKSILDGFFKTFKPDI